MALTKITENDLAGKGVLGQADVPGLTAAEMQTKVEEIVRSVVIPNINGNIDELEGGFATKEELGEVVLSSGSVASVFGRAGSVLAQSGDYTCEQVGAAPAVHKSRHAVGGEDVLSPADIGAAADIHAHGAITSDGRLGITNGLLAVTGSGGALEAKSRLAAGVASVDGEAKVLAEEASSGQKSAAASFILALGDAGHDIVVDSAGAVTVTVPLNASVAFPIDTEIIVFRAGAGAVTIAFPSGITVWCRENSYAVSDRYASVLLKKRGENTWSLEGCVG